jgi:hypothetical protein
MNDKIMVVELFDSIGLLKSQNFVKKIARTLIIIDNKIKNFYD